MKQNRKTKKSKAQTVIARKSRSEKSTTDVNPNQIAPHFDTPTSDRRPDPTTEISKSELADGFQTDSRP